jgi:hypothetical protein
MGLHRGYMKNKPNTNTHTSTTTQIAAKAKSIKLGIDVHADSHRVVRQVDHATPQPAQKFSPDGFLLWAKSNWSWPKEVHSCYEAGPFGYGLHRQLEQMGIYMWWSGLRTGTNFTKASRLTKPTRWLWFSD